MSGLRDGLWRTLGEGLLCVLLLVGLKRDAFVQTVPYERTFPQSRATIEKVLKQLQPQTSGRLPTLEGFAASADRSLDHFQRGYFQCTENVVGLPTGGTRVRVSAKITAWYADPNGSRSGYEVLPSNGRIESDFLDQLQEILQRTTGKLDPPSAPAAPNSGHPSAVPAPQISAPAPQDTIPGEPIAPQKSTNIKKSPFASGASTDELSSVEARKSGTDKHSDELAKEAKSLEEIALNQSRPNNLVAVTKSETPVLVSPVEGAKVLFLATAEDEFEILDTNPSWVHIRISGLSRGWIRRNAVEMPDTSTSVPETRTANTPTQAASQPADKKTFQVENEQIASFPGNWEPLRGKTVKIVSVQEAKDRPSDTGSQAKLDYAKSVFEREYVELSRESTLAAGVVVVFDAEDGGMMATTLPVLQQWKAGTLSDDALWRRCYFDPPEMFRAVSMR